jgi:hypothetical protein
MEKSWRSQGKAPGLKPGRYKVKGTSKKRRSTGLKTRRYNGEYKGKIEARLE